MIRDILKAWFVPGTPSFLILAIAASLPFIAARRTRVAGATVVTIVIGCYLVLSTPIVAIALLAPLARQHAPADAHAHEPVDAVLLLIGDSPAERAIETVRLFREARPPWVIVSGPAVWADVLRVGGVPPERIIVESQAGTTFEQAQNLRALVTAHHIDSILLVASQVHMPRAFAVFRTLGYRVIPAPSPIDYSIRSHGLWKVVPQPGALELSRDAIYEYCALPYYRWQGRIARATSGPTRS